MPNAEPNDSVVWGDAAWVSPWVMHVVVALEEKRLPYRVERAPLPIAGDTRAALLAGGLAAKVPVLVHGGLYLGESLAISEYLAETFPVPEHPRLFPADLRERGLARQIMGHLRTDTFALRDERPTSLVFGTARATAPLSAKARAEADELIRIATRAVAPGASSMFAQWCIADLDLAVALMRMVVNGDPVPAHLVAYAEVQWQRPSSRAYMNLAA